MTRTAVSSSHIIRFAESAMPTESHCTYYGNLQDLANTSSAYQHRSLLLWSTQHRVKDGAPARFSQSLTARVKDLLRMLPLVLSGAATAHVFMSAELPTEPYEDAGEQTPEAVAEPCKMLLITSSLKLLMTALDDRVFMVPPCMFQSCWQFDSCIVDVYIIVGPFPPKTSPMHSVPQQNESKYVLFRSAPTLAA